MKKFDQMNKDFDAIFNQVDQVFKEVDKTFKTMESVMDQEFQKKASWKPHTLWWPKRVKGKWYWPTERVYRKFVLSPGGGFYVYGDDFDVLKDAN